MIGYYAHSHGSGHCNYANIFAKIFGKSLTVFTDRGHAFDSGTEVVMLENEDPDGSEYDRDTFPEPRALHYAPVNITKITRRNRVILENVLSRNISLMIIDVSVEIAMLARVSSIPYAYVRLMGDRDDIAHLNAFEGASFLLAYFPREMESSKTPLWIVDKTVYLGFLSKYMFGEITTERPEEFKTIENPVLLYLTGFGGSRSLDFGNLLNSYDIFAIGPQHTGEKKSGAVQLGVVDSTRRFLEHADIIVAACGSNTTSEILSLGKRFVAVAEKRQYREQELMAENLDRLGWAIDLSKYATLNHAVTELEHLDQVELPNVSVDQLKAFKEKMNFLGFRADRLAIQNRYGVIIETFLKESSN